MDFTKLIDAYVAGPKQLRKAVAGMTREQLAARPVAGKWSTLEVVCHLADFEPIYADRMKRVLAEDKPTLMSGDPDKFAAALRYHDRDVGEELAIIESVRGQMAKILRTCQPEDFARVGIHSEAGPRSVQQLLESITEHIPHHVPFIEEKRRVLGLQHGKEH
jgi:uncharacterized damage-inducible protein DinB